MNKTIAALSAILACACASSAAAHTVYRPYVEKGVFEAEVRTERAIGGEADGESEALVEFGYGVTDRLHLAVFGEYGDAPGEDRQFEATGLEAVMYLGRVE